MARPSKQQPDRYGYVNLRNSASPHDIQASRESGDGADAGNRNTAHRKSERMDTLSKWVNMRRPNREREPSRESYIHLFRETGDEDGDDSKQANRRWMLRPWINHHYDNVENSHVPMVFSPEAKVIAVWNNAILFPAFWSLFAVPMEVATTLTFCVLESCTIFYLCTHMDTLATCAFAMSVLLKFNTAIEDKDGTLIFDRGTIAQSYLLSWFLIDTVCAVPFEVLGSSLRVLKLARIVVSIRVLHVRDLYNCILVTVLVTHWIACLWFGLALAHGRESGETWVDSLSATKAGVDESVERQPLRLYLWSAYYAVTLVTTVGFGDVTPQTDMECMCCMASTFIGVLIWAYVQSAVLSWVCELAAVDLKIELNLMIQRYRIHGELKRDVLQYFHNSEKNVMLKQRRQLFDRMSQTLRGRVMFSQWGDTMKKISFIARIYQDFSQEQADNFVREMCQLFDMEVFGKGERVSSAKLTVLQQGIVWHGKAVKISGQYIGDDFILTNPENRSGPALAVTFVSALTIGRRDFLLLCRENPDHERTVRRASLWLAMKQATPRLLHEMCEEQGYLRHTTTMSFLSMMNIGRTQTKLPNSARGGKGGMSGIPGVVGSAAFGQFEELLEEQRDMLEKQATELQEARKREEALKLECERQREEQRSSTARMEDLLEEQREQSMEAFKRLETLLGGGRTSQTTANNSDGVPPVRKSHDSEISVGRTSTASDARVIQATSGMFSAFSPKKITAPGSSSS